MSIIYKSQQQQQHVNFNETAAESVQCSRSEPSVRSNNNDNLNQSTDSHNNNNRSYNHDEMVGTQQNLNQLQISSTSSSALRDSNTSFANDLDATAKPTLSAQTESTAQHTFPVVMPSYINSSYGSSAEMYHERKLHLKSSPDKVQDLSEYIRDHSKNMNLPPSCTDGCVVIPRSTNQGMYFN